MPAISVTEGVLRVHARSQIARARADFALFSEMLGNWRTDWLSAVYSKSHATLYALRKMAGFALLDRSDPPPVSAARPVSSTMRA
jgi:hypothetical protein